MDTKIKKYRHDADYSYTPGMTLTVEMIRCAPQLVRRVYVHPDYQSRDPEQDIRFLCDQAGISWEMGEKIFSRLGLKENAFVLGVFSKADAPIQPRRPHVVLVNPSDAGNLGTILRTGAGFGFHDFAIVRPGVDIFDPKVIRASMGAFFHIRFTYYDAFDDYRRQFPEQLLYPFMLKGKTDLKQVAVRPGQPFSLVFGNEATGLPDTFLDCGESVIIRHSREIDSLNLSIAFGIAAHWFGQ